MPAQSGPETPGSGPVLPFGFARVHGPSMVPTLRSGDLLLVRHGAPGRAGDVVLAVLPGVPGTVVKRVVTPLSGGRAVLASDSAAAGGDSRTHGPGDVLARVLGVRRGRWRWRRVPPPV